MKFSGKTDFTERGFSLLTWDKCGIFKDNGELLDCVSEANLRLKAGGLAVLEVKMLASEPVNRHLPKCPFPEKSIVRKEKSGSTDIDVYEFAVISFEVETKESLGFLESHV